MNRRTLAYWAATAPLALILTGSGAGALTAQPQLMEAMQNIGFPLYVRYILGSWYIAAAIAFLIPAAPRVKEWAYAGVAFAMTGALAAHFFSGDGVPEYAPPIVIASLAAASYWLRPASRRLGDG